VEIVALLLGVIICGGTIAGLLLARRHRSRGSRPRSSRAIDAFALGEPWRRHVAAAQSAQRRFQGLVASVPAGPLRLKMVEIGRQVDRAVEECWEIAKRGAHLDDTIRGLDPPAIKSRLEVAKDPVAIRSLESQLASVERVRTARDDTDNRLRVLQTRLGELVSQTAEVTIGVDHTGELGTAVEDVVVQLEALRLATREVAQLPGSTSAQRPGPGTTAEGTA
jgi:hypothetical protein